MSTKLNVYLHVESGIRLFSYFDIYPDMLSGLFKEDPDLEFGHNEEVWINGCYTGEDFYVYTEQLEDIPKLYELMKRSQFSDVHVCVEIIYFNTTLKV